MTNTIISPQEAARALGMDEFTIARYLRTEAAKRLTILANNVERGGESNQGDVDLDEYTNVMSEVWNLVEAAQVCDAVWQAE